MKHHHKAHGLGYTSSYSFSPTVYVPSIYKAGTVGYGASEERYLRRFSRKKERKLQRKLARFERRLAKLQGREGRIFQRMRDRRIARLTAKINAIRNVLNMDPFAMTIADEAAAQAALDMPEQDPVNLGLVIALGGVAVVGVVLLAKKKSKKSKK